MQRVRAPAVEIGPVMPNSIPGFLRASTFGARQNRNGTVRITGGYRFSAMLHDLSLNDLRDIRLWAPRLWQNRREVSLRLNLPSLALDVAYAMKRRRAGGEAVVPQGYLPPASARDRVPQISALGGLVPSLQGARISRFFSGVMDLTPDLQPIIGKIPGTENGYVVTGFSGHGYLAGPGACVALAELVHEGRTDIDLSPFTPERLSRGIPPMREQIF